MKSGKVWLIGLKVAFLVICVTFGTAHSQDLSGWVGKWFKLTYSYKGYETYTNPTHIPETQKFKETLYVKIMAWDTIDPSNPFLKCSGYGEDEEENVYQNNFDLRYLGGTDLDFLILCHFVSEEQEHIGFTARISGKESSKGTLKSATFKTLGGYSWERSSDPFNPRDSQAEELTISGSLISESRLPSWVPQF